MRLLFVFLALTWATEAYRLNVPRVLLPYHPTISVKFILEVSQPSGGCFHWRSTRSDVVTVTGVGVRSGECSDRAEVRVSAKSFAGELTAVVFAEDKLSHTTLSCGVSVDQIAEIRIGTTTKVLFVDAAPARMVVEAINSEGDIFSTLSEIPLDWELAYSGSDRPLRIVQFEQSTYDAPTEILALEKQKKKGYVILVEGTGTGSATLTAKFNDQFLSHIPPFNLDLAVIANLLLIPSQDLYVFPHTVVPFQVIIVRQHSQEIVPMPSDNYYLQLENTSICSLDKRASSVYALAKGRTNVILQAQNVDLKAKTGIRPPSTVINVVDPDTLQWSISGNSWIVQRGRSYELQVNLIDPHGNGMYIGDNLRFESFLDSKVLDIHHSSENQSYFVVTPKEAGKTAVRSRFTSVLTKEGRMDPIGGKISGEQNVEVVDPLQIIPSVVVIPFTNKARMDSQLKAIGGTGSYMWSVEDNSICKVEKNSGVLSCSSIGSTRVTVTDRRNEDLFATAEVLIVDPLSVSFGETVKEAEVGTDLVLNVDLRGSGPKGQISFTDCRQIRWRVHSDDASILEPIQAESTLPTVGTGCGTVRLRAISAGDTTVRISHDNLQAEVQVSTHLPLKASVESVALAVASSHVVRLEGGSRPWLLDSSGFFRKGKNSADVFVSFLDDGMVKFMCAGRKGTETIELFVGNSKSSSLPIPLVSSTSISICCTSPTRLVLSFEQNKCHAVPPVVLSTSSVPVTLSAYGNCGGKERFLDSFSSFEVNWRINDASLGRLETSSKTPVGRVLSCRGKSGLVTVTAEMSVLAGVNKKVTLSATSDIRLVQPVAAFPSSLVLWNEEGSSGFVELRGGSGQFAFRRTDSGPFAASIKDRKVTVAPKMQGSGILRVTDNCLPDADIDISVKITKIDALAISAPAYVEVGSTVEVLVEAVDETGTAYPYDLSETKLDITNRAMQILKRQGQRYVLTASEVGAVSLSATAKSSSGPLSSRPHSIQVYSPISFEPKIVTLIPESTFQLEVIGGPLPTPPIVFSLNNSKIADVQSNALITSKDLGYTSITGAVSFASDHSSTETVVLRVVSLAGITLSASTTVLERGGRLWITVRGIDETEVPFAFGGATYPFKVKWSIESPEVLNPAHPFGESFVEPTSNRFSIWLDAATVGTTKVNATVELSEHAKHHFVGRNRVFSSSVVVNVKEIPGLLQPQMPLSTVRMGPNSALPLHLNLPESTVEFVQRLNSIVAVTPTGTVRSTSREGSDFVAVTTNTPAGNETILIPVVVSSPVALDVVSATTGLYAREDHDIYNLPVGAVLTLNVFARDFLGRRLHSIKSDIRLRPHRFDLTEISSNSDGSEISVTLRASGETVLKIWDASSASTSPVYVRILAGEAIIPAGAKYFVSDVICLHSPLSGQSHWFSADSGIQFLDASLGVARFVKPGLIHLSVQTDSQTLHAKAAVEKARVLKFVEGAVPYVSNIEGAVFTFPFAPSNTTPNRDCNEEQRKLVSDLRPPVECSLQFDANTVPPAFNLLSAKAVYSMDSGSYACVVSRQSAGSVYVNVVEFPRTHLLVKAKWDGLTDGESVTRTVFHAAMEVQGSEVRVSDAQQSPTVLSVAVPSYQLQQVSAFGCEGDLLTIKELSQSANQQANKFFAISLNVKSAALWSETANKCSITIRNSATGQTILLPVRVKIVGQEMKQVYNALESNGFIDFSVIVLQRYKWIIPSLMWICVIGIAVLLGYSYLKNYVWEKTGVYTDESILRSPQSASSRLSASANSSLRDSFHSSPGNSPRAGSTDQLWSTSELRRRY